MRLKLMLAENQQANVNIIILSIFSDNNSVELEIKHKEISGKNTNTWSLTNMLLNNKWTKRFQRGNKKNTWRHMKMKT